MLHPTNKIHPTAIIGNQVKLGQHNEIGPHVVLEGDLIIGDRNKFHTGVIFTNRVEVGNDNQFFPYVTVGYQGEMGSKGDSLAENGKVIIGNKNTIREYVNVHFPVRTESTFIGDENYIMNKVYIAHDVKIHDKVTLTAGVLLAGRSKVQSYANLGMGAAVHQRSCVGAFAMVGMNAVVKQSILPFCAVIGAPTRILKFNAFGAKRGDFSEEDILAVVQNFPDIIDGNSTLKNAIVDSIEQFKTTNPNFLDKFYNKAVTTKL